MNNTDFRRFVLDTPRQQKDAATSPSGFAKPSAPASSLGSKSKSSIPMTPRTVKGAPSLEFARQVAEQKAASQQTKKFRSSAAPKGSKYGDGYTDRARERAEGRATEDEREARIQALEEQMKLGQIERETFENLRDSITGGHVGATHLVKGLDRQLLERVRRGEDVLSSSKTETSKLNDADRPDADEEFEKLEQKELASIEHDKTEKKGQMAPPPKPLAGSKRSRNDILAELKATRKAAAEAKAASQPQLGARFKRLGDKAAPEPRMEKDEKGRDVLITVDENGRVKRKVRKLDSAQPSKAAPNGSLPMPDKHAKPMGMAVPITRTTSAQKDQDGADSDSEDIFKDVGDSYNPLQSLAGAIDDESSSASSSDNEKEDDSAERESKVPSDETLSPTQRNTLDQTTDPPAVRHNYFNDAPSHDEGIPKGLDDPSILETIKRAAAIRPPADSSKSPVGGDGSPEGAPSADSSSAAARRLMQRDRDLDDIDMGFGSSRFGDEDEDGDGASRIKLSEWRGGNDDEEEDGGGDGKGRGGQKQRKRGKKKKKGDKNSAADVLSVMEGRRR